MANQTIQSLFQVLYLGSTVVDRHCSHAVMLWITEELKLRTNQRILTWLTSGERGGRGGEGGRGRGRGEGVEERWSGRSGGRDYTV